MKKVLLIETLSEINGGQKMSLLVSDMLQAHGDYEVIWAIPEEGILSEKLRQRKYRYYLLGNLSMPAGVKGKKIVFKYAKMSIISISILLSIIRKEKIDIIYAPGPAALPWSAICGSILNKKVIWHLHHNFTDGPTKKLINICGGFGSVKSVLAVSSTVGNQIQDSTKVQVLFNPVDCEKYSTGLAEKVITMNPFCTGSKIICQVALLENEKNQMETIETLAELIKMGEDFRAVFVGTTKPGDEKYLEYLKGQSIKLGVSDRCYFLGYRTDVPDLLKASDIAIIPSIEGFPLAGLEACSAGIPVVACDVAGAAELIDQGKCGVKYKYNDCKDAAKCVLKCLSQEAVYKAAGIEFAKNCQQDKYKKKIISIFESATNEKNSNRF